MSAARGGGGREGRGGGGVGTSGVELRELCCEGWMTSHVGNVKVVVSADGGAARGTNTLFVL